MSTQRDQIDSIRRSWGVGLPEGGDRETKAAIDNLRRQLGNALELLSEQLYSSESHFLLELLQNADDNDYPDGVVPSFNIHIAAGCLSFQNNEIGFSPDEVRALCGIGESTKKGKKAVKTGEKGIGFKAVFKISDRPEVHSNGFHFSFDRETHRDLGLVIPNWIEVPKVPQPAQGTTIVLPLRGDLGQDLDLASQLHPELLLFVRRLRFIGCHDARNGATVQLAHSNTLPIVEVMRHIATNEHPATESNRFFIHRRTINVENLTDDLRPDIRQTDVVVALPLAADDTADADTARAVFAFLPVTEAGFGFVLHADFVLNASREAILKDRPWNIRLRDELGVTLAEAITHSQAVPPLGQSALRFLTRPRDIADEFMREVLVTAIERLKSAECVPTEDGARVKPTAVLRPDDAALFTLVEADDLQKLLGKRYVAGNIKGLADALDLLKCERFELKHLLSCCDTLVWLEKRPLEWFAMLWTLLARLCGKDNPPLVLENAPLLRLTNGQAVSPSSGPVFRSLGGRLAYGFEKDLRILDKTVLDAVPAEEREIVRRFLSQLGVCEPEPRHIIDGHILVTHRNDEKWRDCTSEALIGHVRYVRDHLDDYLKAQGDARAQEAAILVLRQTLRVRTSSRKDGEEWYCNAPDLYLGPSYGDPHDLQALFGDRISENLVFSGYIQGADKEARRKDAEVWSQFLQRLGAHNLPRVLASAAAPSHVTFTYRTRKPGPLRITDWKPSDELQETMEVRDPGKKQKLLVMLDRAWTSLRRYARGSAGWPYAPQDFDSTWLAMLRTMEVQTNDARWVQLQNSYLDSKENRSVFGSTVPYLGTPVETREFLDAVGIVVEPAIEEVIKRLEQLRSGPKADKREVKRLYKYLDQMFEQNAPAITEAFKSRQIVYLDESRWVTLLDCCWDVPPAIRPFAPTPGLSGPWRDLEEFFCERLGLRRQMNADEWVQTLRSLAQSSLPFDQIPEHARQIYRRLNVILGDWEAAHERIEPDWLKVVRAENLLWTTKQEWWRNEQNVLVADDRVLQQLFDGNEGIGFVDIPAAERPRFSTLLDVLGIKGIAESMEVVERPQVTELKAATDFEKRLQARWLHIARLLFHKHPTEYLSAARDGRLQQLRKLPAFVCDPLTLVVQVCGQRAKTRLDARILTDQEGSALFVDRSSEQNWDPIAIELGRFLGVDDIASLTIARVCAAQSEGEIDKLFSLLRLPPIPEDEQCELLGTDPSLVDPAELEDVESDQDAGDPVPLQPDQPRPESGQNDSLPLLQEPVLPGSATTDGQVAEVASATYTDSKTSNEHESGDSQATATVPASDENTTDSSSAGLSGNRAGGGGASTSGIQPQDELSTPPEPPILPDRADRPRTSGPAETKRLISYVSTTDPDDPAGISDPLIHAHRTQVSKAGVEFAMAFESRNGRTPREMPFTNEGYDIESARGDGQIERHIEVKSLAGGWGERGVTLTHPQFEFARNHQRSVWLYVVEYALDPQVRRLHCIPNPVLKITHFGFDQGWQAIALRASSLVDGPPTLEEGARYRTRDGREARISTVKRHGQIVELKLTLSDNTTAREAGPEDQLCSRLIGGA